MSLQETGVGVGDAINEKKLGYVDSERHSSRYLAVSDTPASKKEGNTSPVSAGLQSLLLSISASARKVPSVAQWRGGEQFFCRHVLSIARSRQAHRTGRAGCRQQARLQCHISTFLYKASK